MLVWESPTSLINFLKLSGKTSTTGTNKLQIFGLDIFRQKAVLDFGYRFENSYDDPCAISDA